MKRFAAILALLVLGGLSAWAATIQLSPSPIPLGSAFQVIVTGLEAQAGQAVVVNVKTGELVKVPLSLKGGKLVSEPIYALRKCDSVPQDAHYVLTVKLGDVVAAATELDKGLSTTALITRRQGEVHLAVARWGQKSWQAVAAGSAIQPGRIRIAVDDPAQDESCSQETVPVAIKLGDKSTHLDLVETGGASGRFCAELALGVRMSGQDLSVVLMKQGKELLEAPLVSDTTLTVSYGEKFTASYKIAQLEPEMSLDPDDVEDAGCPIRASITTPADEVHWFINGSEQAAHGPSIAIINDEPTYPNQIAIVALVRSGSVWGKVAAGVTFVPHTEIEFVDADTGSPVSGQIRCGAKLRVKLSNVLDDPRPRVWVGLLGSGCSAKELPLSDQGSGVYLSQPFATDDLSACSGDVLWAEYKDPTCSGDVAYVLVVLK